MHTHTIKLVGSVVICAALLASAFLFVPIAQAQVDPSAEPTTTITETTVSDSAEVTESTNTDTSADVPVDTTVTDTSSDTTTDTATPPPSTDSSADTSETVDTSEAAASLVVSEVVPELSTDKDDYHPGETATIFGKFFGALQSFILKVFGSDENDENYTESTQTVTTDENGAFSAPYTLDGLYRPFYEVYVHDLAGNELASTWFRDAAVDAYDQCSNDDGDGYATGDTGCRWINGALNASNSTYQEGDSTVQRLSLDGFAPGSSHTVTVQYGTTKQGKHAYDFLTKWSHSENWITLADIVTG